MWPNEVLKCQLPRAELMCQMKPSANNVTVRPYLGPQLWRAQWHKCKVPAVLSLVLAKCVCGNACSPDLLCCIMGLWPLWCPQLCCLEWVLLMKCFEMTTMMKPFMPCPKMNFWLVVIESANCICCLQIWPSESWDEWLLLNLAEYTIAEQWIPCWWLNQLN